MIVKRLDELIGTERDVRIKTWNSRRFLLQEDAVGYTLTDTVIPGGTSIDLWYQNHVESVYCIEGEGRLTDKATETTYKLEPGTLYVLNNNDQHILETITDMRFVCVFTPPLVGPEAQDGNGSFPAAREMTEQVAESVAKRVARKVASQVAEQVAEQIAEKVAAHIMEESEAGQQDSKARITILDS